MASELPANADAVTGDELTITGKGVYIGFSFRETSGSATATIRVYDGTTAAGTLLDTIQLTAAESAREWYGPQGIRFTSGLYVDVVTGDIEGSVRWGAS